MLREEIRKLRITSEAEPIVRSLAKARAEMLSDSEGQEAAETVGRLEGQLARAKKLYVTGDYSEEEYQAEKRYLETLIEEEKRKIAPPPYDAELLIGKMKIVGDLIARTEDLNLLKRAVKMLFERIEAARGEDGQGKLLKVIPREEFREFL